jgi:hypothetical protein
MNIVDRVKNILLTPASEWEVIKGEEYSVSDLFRQYAFIMAAIPAVAGFIGYTIFGVSWGFETYRPPFGASLKWAIAMYILSLVGVYIIAFIMDALAPTFGSSKNFIASLKVVVFASTASWVAGIFSVFPALAFVSLIGSIYSLVLMYMGLKRVKDVPDNKMVGYFVTLIVVSIIVYMITAAIIATFAFGSAAMYG